MKVGLAELDKKLMLNKEGKLFSRNLSKISWKDLGADEKRFQKYPEEILGRMESFQEYPEKILGRTKKFQNILERFWGGRLQN